MAAVVVSAGYVAAAGAERASSSSEAAQDVDAGGMLAWKLERRSPAAAAAATSPRGEASLQDVDVDDVGRGSATHIPYAVAASSLSGTAVPAVGASPPLIRSSSPSFSALSASSSSGSSSVSGSGAGGSAGNSVAASQSDAETVTTTQLGNTSVSERQAEQAVSPTANKTSSGSWRRLLIWRRRKSSTADPDGKGADERSVRLAGQRNPRASTTTGSGPPASSSSTTAAAAEAAVGQLANATGQLANATGVRWPFSWGRRPWLTSSTSGIPAVDASSSSSSRGQRASSSGGSAVGTVLPSSSVDMLPSSSASITERRCPVCFEVQAAANFPAMTSCAHRTCRQCLVTYFGQEVVESRTRLACPECAEVYQPHVVVDILSSVGEARVQQYLDFALRKALASEADVRWCPAPDCGYGVIASNCDVCPRIACERPGCDTAFCYHCRYEWHPLISCDEAERRRIRANPSSVLTGVTSSAGGGKGGRRGGRNRGSGDDQPQLLLKPCPKCGTKIMKANDGSCNHITCSVCDCHFCWLCLKVIDDLHFISPSGCTFWGKRPWSRKKTILAQIAVMLGAPLGLALITALTPPIVMLAFPVYCVQAAKKRQYRSKLRKALAVAGGLVGGVLLAPILAALGLAIFLPIAFFFCYAVLPCQLVIKLMPCLEDEPDPNRFGVAYDDEVAAAGGDPVVPAVMSAPFRSASAQEV